MKQLKPIFLVDDDEDDRIFLKDAFDNDGNRNQLIELCDGIELMEILYSKTMNSMPAAIVMDINMPRMSGLQALSKIKSDPGLCHIPVIMVSTSSDKELIEKAYQKGVDAYHIKPVAYCNYTYIIQNVISRVDNASGNCQ